MLWKSKNFGSSHQRWLYATIILLFVSVGLYLYVWAGEARLPGGASKIGLAYGVAAGLIFLFEFLLWPRKTSLFRTARWLGKTQTWMHAHLWLGLLTLPLVAMHCGLSVGGPFTLAFLVLYGLVFASGIFGLAIQNYLPSWLLDLVPHETVASQMDVVAKQLAVDADRILSVYVGNSQPTLSLEEAAESVQVRQAGLQVGALRKVGTMTPLHLHPHQVIEKTVSAPEVTMAVRTVIEPYLRNGHEPRQLLGNKRRNAQYFGELRRITPPALREAVETLGDLCERRRQLTVQEKLHSWLHGWMLVHLPLSVALMVLLVGHIFMALCYN